MDSYPFVGEVKQDRGWEQAGCECEMCNTYDLRGLWKCQCGSLNVSKNETCWKCSLRRPCGR